MILYLLKNLHKDYFCSLNSDYNKKNRCRCLDDDMKCNDIFDKAYLPVGFPAEIKKHINPNVQTHLSRHQSKLVTFF